MPRRLPACLPSPYCCPINLSLAPPTPARYLGELTLHAACDSQRHGAHSHTILIPRSRARPRLTPLANVTELQFATSVVRLVGSFPRFFNAKLPLLHVSLCISSG